MRNAGDRDGRTRRREDVPAGVNHIKRTVVNQFATAGRDVPRGGGMRHRRRPHGYETPDQHYADQAPYFHILVVRLHERGLGI